VLHIYFTSQIPCTYISYHKYLAHIFHNTNILHIYFISQIPCILHIPNTLHIAYYMCVSYHILRIHFMALITYTFHISYFMCRSMGTWEYGDAHSSCRLHIYLSPMLHFIHFIIACTALHIDTFHTFHHILRIHFISHITYFILHM
jgi:hypothetical protein